MRVTYCTVCRSGRAFSPVVDGRLETFRLVGMDHFNAMFEDPTTGSWWRQVSGEADWNRLRRERVVNDELGARSIVLVLATDAASFFAFERPDRATTFALRNDSVVTGDRAYDLGGRGARGSLTRTFASQEFLHSWRTFHPSTTKW